MSTVTTTSTSPSFMLRLAQMAWIVFVTISIGLYVLGGMFYFRELQTVCTASRLECHSRELATPEDVAQLQAEGITLRDWAIAHTVFRAVITCVFCAVGFLIFARKHNEWNGLLFSLFLISVGTLYGNKTALIASYPAMALLVNIVSYPAFVMYALFFATFPNGRVVPRVMWIPVALWSLYFFLDMFIGWPPPGSGLWNVLAATAWLGMFGSGASAQVYRYLRASNEQERRQTKWVVFAIAVLIISLLIAYFSPLFSQFATNETHSRRSLALLIGINFLNTLIPITIGIAILRYRLFAIDVIIRRTLVYGTLTAFLALIYIGTVVALQRLLTPLFGGSDQITIVASTLTIAALFQPLRRRIQALIDRRFFRRKYDAQQTLQAFSARLRDETDLTQLTNDTLAVVQETLQPAHVSLWLREPEGEAKP